jgi:fatty acid desaturase
MARKVLRDLTGVIGLKRLLGGGYLLAKAALRPAGAPPVRVMTTEIRRTDARRAVVGFAVTQLGLAAVLWTLGVPWLFAVWALAWLTVQNLVTRIRSIAEHSMTPDVADPFLNTRTVKTNPLTRLFAPNRVNYHLEHHLVMTVPHHQLPRFHRMLRERGLLERATVASGYLPVLRAAAGRRA